MMNGKEKLKNVTIGNVNYVGIKQKKDCMRIISFDGKMMNIKGTI